MSKVALVPYWLQQCPSTLKNSDNDWWFAPLMKFEKIIFCGPYIKDGHIEADNRYHSIISLKLNSLHFTLKDVEQKLKSNVLNIEINEIDVVWNVLEATPTCRIRDLSSFNGAKIALIGDTHHFKRPISSLIPYINSCHFDYIFCTQSHHSFFFKAFCPNSYVASFPYSRPINFNKELQIRKVNKSSSLTNLIVYRGSILSDFHKNRSRLINYLLCHVDIQIRERLSWNKWLASLNDEQSTLVICSINGNFSPQLMFPLLYGCKILYDKPAEANWLGEIIHNNDIGYPYQDPRHCLEVINNSLSEPIEIQTQKRMRSIKKISNKLHDLNSVQELLKNNLDNILDLPDLQSNVNEYFVEVMESLIAKDYLKALRVLDQFELIQSLTCANKRETDRILIHHSDCSPIIRNTKMLVPQIEIESSKGVYCFKSMNFLTQSANF